MTSRAMPAGMYKYGPLDVAFADGSVGWYEAGWGQMMSATAFFVKDAIGPMGSASIVRVVEPLRIVPVADRSVRTGEGVTQ
jgi:hypothetical protein